ncbi:50S ribosomal protein L9 [Candidatus Binatia bacterium]|nr:50S ribosomal protein L9 [Candidatus Binatia bacterium]
MEVILREDVEHLGAMGEVVKVKPGYARNFLLPRGMAVEASRKNLTTLEHEKGLIAIKRERERKLARAEADKLDGLVVEILARAGEEDRLYGSVTNLDIAQHLAERGVKVDRRRIDLDDPIKRLGTYRIVVGVAHDVKATITVKVLPEAAAE